MVMAKWWYTNCYHPKYTLGLQKAHLA